MTHIFAREGAVKDPHQVSLKVTNLRTGKRWVDNLEIEDGVVTWISTEGWEGVLGLLMPEVVHREALFELTPEQKAGRCSVGTLLP